MKRLLLVLCVSILSLNTYSETLETELLNLEYSVNERSCIRLACESMGAFSCRSESELKRIVATCKGNYGAGCLKQSISYLTSHEYNNLYEMIPLIESCQDVYDLECPKFMCKRLGHFVCGRRRGIIKANNLCKED